MCRVQQYLNPLGHSIACSLCKPGEALSLFVDKFMAVQYHGRGIAVHEFESLGQKGRRGF